MLVNAVLNWPAKLRGDQMTPERLLQLAEIVDDAQG